MKYFTDSFLTKRRQQFLRSLYRVQLYFNGRWISGDFETKEIEGNEVLLLANFPDLRDEAGSIARLRILDVAGEVAYLQDRNVDKIAGEGLFVKVTIPIYEVEEDGN